jgi:hypothetical protein
MRRIVLCSVLAACLASAPAFSQGVAINSSAAPADTSALLDLSSTIKGFLPPRMTALQRATIPLPALGLVVYQTDGSQGLWINAGTPGAPNWKLLLDNTSVPGNPWLASGSDLYYTNGRVGVGTSSPSYRLTVEDALNGLRVQTDNAGGQVASFAGAGTFFVDAPFIPGGRLAILENGNVGLGVTSPATRLDVAGGSYDVTNTEGDFRLGSATYRLKMGVAVSGGGAGDTRIMQQGVPGGFNVLTLGAQGTGILMLNGNTARVGIGTNSPTAALGFPATLGKKITLYPGATGDAGFGMAGNRLQIFADNPNADVAMGYDAAGTFNERFAVKPTGALAVNGNTGTAGQVLSSNGSSSAATWVSPTNSQYNNITIITTSNSVLIADHTSASLPDLTKTLTLSGPAKVIVSVSVRISDPGCVACGASSNSVYLDLDNVDMRVYTRDLANGATDEMTFTDGISVSAGTHTIKILGFTISGSKTIKFGEYGVDGNSMTLQVIPQ